MGPSFDPLPIKLSESAIQIEDPLSDVRGRRVITADGQDIGTVTDLLVDPPAKTIRFLELETERASGIGRHLCLVPVQSVARVDDFHVYLGCSRDVIGSAPIYNPHVALADLYLQEIAEHFGFPVPGTAGTEPTD